MGGLSLRVRLQVLGERPTSCGIFLNFAPAWPLAHKAAVHVLLPLQNQSRLLRRADRAVEMKIRVPRLARHSLHKAD